MNDVIIIDTTFVQHNVDEEDQLSHWCHHKNKFAITFGLINTTFVVMFPFRDSRIWSFNCCDNYHIVAKFPEKILMGVQSQYDDSNWHYQFKHDVYSRESNGDANHLIIHK
jgi:hypothetical protein